MTIFRYDHPRDLAEDTKVVREIEADFAALCRKVRALAHTAECRQLEDALLALSNALADVDHDEMQPILTCLGWAQAEMDNRPKGRAA